MIGVCQHEERAPVSILALIRLIRICGRLTHSRQPMTRSGSGGKDVSGGAFKVDSLNCRDHEQQIVTGLVP